MAKLAFLLKNFFIHFSDLDPLEIRMVVLNFIAAVLLHF